MTEEKADHYSPDYWSQLMGKDLPASERQPLQPARIENGKLRVFAGTLEPLFPPGTPVGLQREGNRIALAEVPDGVPVRETAFEGPRGTPWWDSEKYLELELGETIWRALSQEEPLLGMIVQDGEHLEFLPVQVQEHGPDILGPRIIDELRASSDETRYATIVRHIVKGLEYGDWTHHKLRELEDLLCSSPFSCDPLKELATGKDWVAWKVRKDILQKPDPDDAQVRQNLVNAILMDQSRNGSWGNSVVRTAYAILRALAMDVPPDDARIQRAAQWLLNRPEPVDRPGMWMLTEEHLREWNAIKQGELKPDGQMYFDTTVVDEEQDLFRSQESQRVIPTCARHFAAMCFSRMLHPSATVADAPCRCGYSNHPRLRDYANSILQLGGMFGYFCGCWGIVDFDVEIEDLKGDDPDFNQRTTEYEIALNSIPYGYARDKVDLCVLARRPQYPGIHRPDLADTNGWVPYEWRSIGLENHFAVVGSYWQNADCWAKTNRALSQFPTWPGSIAAFLALFQCHLYQTPLGEWNQGFPAGIFRWIAEVTRLARAKHELGGSSLLRFAELILLRTIPWLRQHQDQEVDGLWDHHKLARFGQGKLNRPLGRRLGTYHIVSVLSEFKLLDRICPRT